MRIRFSLGLAIPLLLALAVSALGSSVEEVEETFPTSLHATGRGMRHWYEADDGFMSVTGIPYDDERLDCTGCHVQSCDQCHTGEQTAGGDAPGAVDDPDACLTCHARQRLTIEMLASRGTPDVHFEAGMVCMDCHSLASVHGDGVPHQTRRAPGAPRASCIDCHEDVLDAVEPHTVHGEKLDCAVCHLAGSSTCLNCHLDSVIEDGTRKDNYIASCELLLLVNAEGKVTSGTAMSLLYGGNKFICFAPYFTHAVQYPGRDCGECHSRRLIQLQRARPNPLPVAKFDGSKLAIQGGPLPLVPERLDWPFLEREGGIWMPSSNPDPPQVQYLNGATPFTPEQFEAILAPQELESQEP